MMRKIAWMIEDLPAPVLPTMPTFEFLSTVKLRSSRASGSPGLYRADRFLNCSEFS